MEYRFMGRTGLKVSELCFGTQTFGWGADEKTAHAMADRFVEAGSNFFDTSNTYNEGQAEIILGRWLKSRGHRSDFIVATKVFFPIGEGPKTPACRANISSTQSMSACAVCRLIMSIYTKYIAGICALHWRRRCGHWTTWCALERCATLALLISLLRNWIGHSC